MRSLTIVDGPLKYSSRIVCHEIDHGQAGSERLQALPSFGGQSSPRPLPFIRSSLKRKKSGTLSHVEQTLDYNTVLGSLCRVNTDAWYRRCHATSKVKRCGLLASFTNER